MYTMPLLHIQTADYGSKQHRNCKIKIKKKKSTSRKFLNMFPQEVKFELEINS